MFEQQIEKTIALVSERTIGTDSSIKLNRILDSNIIEPFKTFFSADVDEWMGGELQRLLDSPHFDYSVDELRATLEELNIRSKMHAVYKREEFLQALERGTKLLFNYTCRPQWTQTKFVYNDLQKIAVPDIFRGLRYFSDYPYYRTILEKYFSKRDIAEFPVTKFDELLSLIDQEVVKNFNSSQMAELTVPIYQLFTLDPDPASGAIPLEALQVFFDDKGNSAIVERLQKEHEEKGDIAVSLHDLKFLVADVEFAIGVEISELVTKHVVRRDTPEEPVPADTVRVDDVQIALEETPQVFEVSDQMTAPVFEVPLQPAFDADAPVQAAPVPPEMSEQFEPEQVGQVFEVPQEEMELPIEVRAAEASTEEREPSFRPGEAAAPPPDIRFSESPVYESLEAEFDKAFGSQEISAEVGTIPVLQEPIAAPPVADAIPDLSTSFTATARPQEQIESTLETELHHPSTPEPAIPEFSFTPDEEMSAPAPAAAPQPAAAPTAFDTSAALDAIARFGDLRKTMNARDQKKFVKKIFDRSDDRFNTAIDVLNTKPTWKEASEYIDEIFLTNNVDMYSRIAVQFTDEIYKRYLQKK